MSESAKTSLESVVQTAIDSYMKEVHTCLPALVVAVNHSTQLIDAQITIKRQMKGELINLPLLKNVPLRYYKSNIFSITFPIEVNDNVMIIFAERSIDTWLTEGDIQNPFDIRKFSLSDAFAIPMMYHQKDVIPSFDSTNLQIKTNDGSGTITLTPSGDIELNGNGDTTIAYTDMKTAFDQLKTDLNNFITVYNAHIHGTSPPPNTTATASTADMSPAEVADVKVT